jgi:hypothetical protein
MFTSWHSITLGAYNPEDRWVGLDYPSLFFDALKTELTLIHEMTHYVLCKDTDFGQAVEAIYELTPHLNHFDKSEKDRLKVALRDAQIFVQEGTASLMEMLRLKRLKDKPFARNWARENMRQDYYERFEKLSFVFDMSNRYRDFFTKKVPNIALHTGIRRAIVEQDLLSDSNKLLAYLSEANNNPDRRFLKLIETLVYKPFLVTKTTKEICKETGVVLVDDVSKEDVACFLTYLLRFTDKPRKVKADEIKDARDSKETMEMSFEDMFVANLNLNLASNGIFLWSLEDLLHYEDVVEAVLVNRLGDDLEWRDELELMTGRKFDAGVIAFSKNGEKFLIGLAFDEVVGLLNGGFSDKSVFVKWGLCVPGEKEIVYFSGSGMPNVVIYNSIKHLVDNFQGYFKKGKKAEYMYLSVENHPFHSLVLQDSSGVLHWLNAYGNKHVDIFLTENKPFLTKGRVDMLSDPKHFNATFSVWMGFPWGIDWTSQFIESVQHT